MNIEDLTLKQMKEIASLVNGLHCDTKVASGEEPSTLVGKPVIVRCRGAGVHYGHLVTYSGTEVTLSKSRRMWYWKAAKGHTLSGCAIHGISSESKIAGELESIVLLDACEIIPCTVAAQKLIGGSDEYNH